MKVTLRALRVTKNLTQKEAAKKVGVSAETWANYERFKTFPDVLTIKKIESVFNVNYEDIIFLP
ncbi:XRE family transcriptional regulator [Enterococcus faecalis]|nr:XRE family transcriptional regulator [Enterococcus faecalis]